MGKTKMISKHCDCEIDENLKVLRKQYPKSLINDARTKVYKP